MKLVARIHAFHKWLYETCQLGFTHLAPKSRPERENEKPWKVPWEPGLPQQCRCCTSRDDLVWYEQAYIWQCAYCGQRYHPRIDITEKRPVVHPQAPILRSEKIPAVPPVQGVVVKPAFRTGQLSFLHSRDMLAYSTERSPNGLPRLEWKNGTRIDTGQLQALTKEEKETLDYLLKKERRTG
jgi:hypothetical protein